MKNKSIVSKMENIKNKYNRLAGIYDLLFFRCFNPGRIFVINHINKLCENKPGATILEVGVGTGVGIGSYNRDLKVTAIDVSEEMLRRALKRKETFNLSHVEILKMDGESLAFADNSFDVAIALYVLSVTANPIKMMQEILRVVKSGGRIFILNHFTDRDGVLGWAEYLFSPVARFLGWESYFKASEIMISGLQLVQTKRVNAFGYWRIMEFEKTTT